MKFFLDTEFNERQDLLELISLALVAEDGRELYMISDSWNKDNCNEFVKTRVIPNLYKQTGYGEVPSLPRDRMANSIRQFVGSAPPIFIGDYAAFDHVCLAWVFGPMTALPKGWPYYTRDIQQMREDLGIKLPYSNNLHNALEDARDVKKNYEYILSWNKQPKAPEEDKQSLWEKTFGHKANESSWFSSITTTWYKPLGKNRASKAGDKKNG